MPLLTRIALRRRNCSRAARFPFPISGGSVVRSAADIPRKRREYVSTGTPKGISAITDGRHNNGMHPTAKSAALIIEGRSGRVMPGRTAAR
jgi:hypothetical protein